jgi:hypothetical protein
MPAVSIRRSEENHFRNVLTHSIPEAVKGWGGGYQGRRNEGEDKG